MCTVRWWSALTEGEVSTYTGRGRYTHRYWLTIHIQTDQHRQREVSVHSQVVVSIDRGRGKYLYR